MLPPQIPVGGGGRAARMSSGEFAVAATVSKRENTAGFVKYRTNIFRSGGTGPGNRASITCSRLKRSAVLLRPN